MLLLNSLNFFLMLQIQLGDSIQKFLTCLLVRFLFFRSLHDFYFSF